MASPADEVDVDGVEVRLTNPDKVYFPKLGAGGTKRSARRLLPRRRAARWWRRCGTARRICSASPTASTARRSTRSGFPQKHPDYLETCQVTFPSGRTADALKVTHPSAIAWAAQMGTITLPPVAGALPRRRASRRAAHRPRPAAGHRLHRRRARSPSTCSSRCSTNSASSATRRPPVAAACTSSCGSSRTGTSSRCAGPASRWPARSSGARRTR